MKKMFLPCIAALSAFTACGMFEYHPYEVNIEYRDINAKAIRQIEEKCAGKETVRFVWMGDTQRWYDETEAMVRSINARPDVDFVIHGGDISDFGMNREFDAVHERMRRLDVPYAALIGNHDLLGNGLDVFEGMYGPLNYSFIAGGVKFVCLNTNSLEFDYSEPVPDFDFMRREMGDTDEREYDSTIVVIHAPPLGDQFDNNVANVFQYYVKGMKDLRFCLHAHNHRLEVNDLFGDGVLYYGCDAVKNRSYMLFTVSADKYEYEVVYF